MPCIASRNPTNSTIAGIGRQWDGYFRDSGRAADRCIVGGQLDGRPIGNALGHFRLGGDVGG
jgi:hypothetical protein